jgi:hypothetical protein
MESKCQRDGCWMKLNVYQVEMQEVLLRCDFPKIKIRIMPPYMYFCPLEQNNDQRGISQPEGPLRSSSRLGPDLILLPLSERKRTCTDHEEKMN